MRSNSIFVRPEFCVLIAFSLLALPVQWIVGWVLAAAIHECFHILMMRILQIRILSITLGASGAVIASEPMTPLQELICALSGPLGGLSALLLLRLMPQVALSAAVQSLYNLLPVYPLDGGRAVRCAISILWGEDNAKRISNVMTIVAILLLSGVTLWISCHYHLGSVPILFSVVPLILNAYKNSLQSRKNNSTIPAYPSNSERTIHR